MEFNSGNSLKLSSAAQNVGIKFLCSEFIIEIIKVASKDPKLIHYRIL